MNLFNKGILKLALLPQGLYRSMGVDTHQLESILLTKLEIDDRTPSPLMKMNRRKKKEFKQVGWLSIVSSVLVGSMFLFSFAMSKTPVTQYTVYFSMYIFMLAFSLISDFSSVLMDTRDNFIIFPKPVNSKTIALARILHILVHIAKVTIPMQLPGLLFVFINRGWLSGLLLLVLLNLALLMVVFLVNAFYLLLLNITTPQKFKSIIAGMQIAIAIFIYASYTILPRFAARYEGVELDLSRYKWIIAFPSYWFASVLSIVETHHGILQEWAGLALAVLFPLVCIVFVVKYLAPVFSQKVGALANSSDAPSEANPAKKQSSVPTKSYAVSMANIFARKGAERAGFLLTWRLTSRFKDFKMKVYPFLGYLVVYMCMLSFQGKKQLTLNDIQQQTGAGKMLFVGIIYSASLFVWTAIYQTGFSEKYKAAWIYYTSPLATPGIVIAGAIKSIIVKFFVPVLLLVSIAGIGIVGVKIIPNLLLGACNMLTLVLLMIYVDAKRLPFSGWQGNENKAGTFVRTILKMLFIGAFGVGHYLVYDIMPLVILFSVLSAVGFYFVFISIRDLNWDKVLSTDMA